MNSTTREMFSRMGGGSQMVFLALFWFVGLAAAGFIVVALYFAIFGVSMDMDLMMQSVSFMKIAQVIQTTLIFVLPSLLFVYLFYANPKEFLKIENAPSLKSILFVIILFVAIQPFIGFTSYLNQQLTLPESFSAVETWMKTQETANEKVILLFISDTSIMGIITNILIIAVLAGVVEELFFRGCMQQIIQKTVYNKHAAVWITAIIFSAIHFQFYGFLPRMLLGALLGYLFVWSNNIWVPIIAHIANNAFTVILSQIYYGTPQFEQMNNFDIQKYWWLSLISLIVSAGLIYLYIKDVFQNKYLTR